MAVTPASSPVASLAFACSIPITDLSNHLRQASRDVQALGVPEPGRLVVGGKATTENGFNRLRACFLIMEGIADARAACMYCGVDYRSFIKAGWYGRFVSDPMSVLHNKSHKQRSLT